MNSTIFLILICRNFFSRHLLSRCILHSRSFVSSFLSTHINSYHLSLSPSLNRYLSLLSTLSLSLFPSQRKAVAQGLECLSMRGYILKYLQEYPELLDLVANDTSSVNSVRCEHACWHLLNSFAIFSLYHILLIRHFFFKYLM